LAVLATLSLYKNEPQSISFRSLPKDGGLIVIKTRPSRGFRWCATVLQDCLIWGSTTVGPSATAEVSIFLQTILMSISAAVALAKTACCQVGS
jgi:hypothetical protein